MHFGTFVSLGIPLLSIFYQKTAGSAVLYPHQHPISISKNEYPSTTVDTPSEPTTFSFDPTSSLSSSSSSSSSSSTSTLPTPTPPSCHVHITSSYLWPIIPDQEAPMDAPMSISFNASNTQRLSLDEFNTDNTSFSSTGLYPNTLILLPNIATIALELRDRPRTDDHAKAKEACWKYDDPSTWGFEFSVNGTAVVDTWMTNTSEPAHCTFGEWVETVIWGWGGEEGLDRDDGEGGVWVDVNGDPQDPVLGRGVIERSRDVDCYYPCAD